MRQVLFYEIVETAQAILISYILIDGSAQAVSHVVGFISAWLKSLRYQPAHKEELSNSNLLGSSAMSVSYEIWFELSTPPQYHRAS